MATHKERVIDYLRANPEGADDDQLAAVLGISQRQTVNQICRILGSVGLVSRRKDPTRGKIVNYFAGNAGSRAATIKASNSSLVEDVYPPAQQRHTLVIVPCGQGKIWDKNSDQGSVLARDAYTGGPFKINRAYAERFAEQWMILSAKYGFISPKFILPGPYNVTFKRKSTNPVSISVLREQIKAQNLGRFQTVIGLGGKEYRLMIQEAFVSYPVKLFFPFAGLPIGKMMQATKRAIETGRAFGLESS